jgi:hypothetical protein
VKTGVTVIIYENFVYQEGRGCRVRIMKNRFANFLPENLKEMSVLKSETMACKKQNGGRFHSECRIKIF